MIIEKKNNAILSEHQYTKFIKTSHRFIY